MLYVTFDRGNLPRFQTEFGVYGNTTDVCIVLSYGGCFYPKKGRKGCSVDKKGAISPNGPRGARRIDTLRILSLWNYGIAAAAFLRGA